MDVDHLMKNHVLNLDLDYDLFLESGVRHWLTEPLEEFLARPQKSIRSRMVKFGFEVLNESQESRLLIDSQLVVEMIHSASLVIDDIQDGSLIRRNKPALHVLEGVPKALNAGTWLYFYALSLISKLPIANQQQAGLTQDVIQVLYEGHIGQALDLGAKAQSVPKEEMRSLCEMIMQKKTGALTGLALSFGARATGQLNELRETLFSVGRELGVLLQMLDDLKNIKLSSLENLKSFEDLNNLRPSFLWSVASEVCNGHEYLELQSCVAKLPDLSEMKNWMVQNSLEERALSIISLRRANFHETVRSVEKQFQLKLWGQIESFIEILEKAYEQE